jgi:hypothetical protein
MRPQATSVCGLELLVYAAFGYKCMRPKGTSACGLKAAGGKGLGALHLFLFFHPQGSHVPASCLTPHARALRQSLSFILFFVLLRPGLFFKKTALYSFCTAFKQPLYSLHAAFIFSLDRALVECELLVHRASTQRQQSLNSALIER